MSLNLKCSSHVGGNPLSNPPTQGWFTKRRRTIEGLRTFQKWQLTRPCGGWGRSCGVRLVEATWVMCSMMVALAITKRIAPAISRAQHASKPPDVVNAMTWSHGSYAHGVGHPRRKANDRSKVGSSTFVYFAGGDT
eukprot:6491489-Amphidinium_carterae.1